MFVCLFFDRETRDEKKFLCQGFWQLVLSGGAVINGVVLAIAVVVAVVVADVVVGVVGVLVILLQLSWAIVVIIIV